MQGYQTLEEAAKFLSMSVDELRLMAQRNQLRSFQDRGTLRFRDQDIQELARQRGVTSNPDVPPIMGQAGSGRVKKKEPTDFSREFNEDQLELGADLVPGEGKNPGSQASPRHFTDFSLEITDDEKVDLGLAPAGGDSDVKLSVGGKSSSSSRRQGPASGTAPPITPPALVKSNLAGPGSASKPRSGASPPRKKSSLSSPTGAPLIPRQSDSDAKIIGPGSGDISLGKDATDSEVPMYRPPGSDDGQLFTDEINLDEEIRKQEAAFKSPSSRARAESPFEVGEESRPSSSQLGNYSLEEAAQYLVMPVEELRQMAQRSQIRSFMSRGTMRFRAPDIQELARQRGVSGQQVEAAGTPPRESHLGFPAAAGEGGGDLDFSLEVSDDQLDIGGELAPGSAARRAGRKKPPGDSDFSLQIDEDQVDVGGDIAGGPKSDRKSASPRPGSDSDVRLMSDQEYSLGADSDIKLVSQESSSSRRKANAPPPSPQKPKSPPSAGPRSPDKSRLAGSPVPKKKSALSSSGNTLIPADSDSDVKIVGAGSGEGLMGKTLGPTDSDIRLDGNSSRAGGEEDAMLLTEEINLDEELRKQEEAQKQKPTASGKVRPKSSLSKSSGTLPASPYELTADDNTPPPSAPSSDSSDFDLSPSQERPTGESDDFSLELPDDGDALGLGELSGSELKGPTSGINLADPVDAGISLEYDDAPHSGNTPRPTQLGKSPAEIGNVPRPTSLGAHDLDDSGSEFELSLDDSSDEMPSAPNVHDSSDFEVGAASDSSSETPSLGADSDSEFELSLDDSSGELASQVQSQDSEFELGAAVDASTEGPALEPSPSEFELSLDDSSGELASQVQSQESDFEVGAVTDSSSENEPLSASSSEFELALDSSSGSDEIGLEPSLDDSASDSEFELTLDDSGSPSSIEEQELLSEEDAEQSDKDIFETDFEVPGLDEESGSQVGALDDTDLESSDFDIEDESGSQVVALDDSQDYADDDQPPAKGKGKGKPAPPVKKQKQPQRQVKKHPPAVQDDEFPAEEEYPEQEEEFEEDLDQQGAFNELAADEGAADYSPPRVVVEERVKYIRPAPWGVLPSIFMFPCLLIMLVIGLLAFESMQNPNPGYKPEGLATKTVKDVLKQIGMM